MLAFGILAAVSNAQQTKKGQVVDCAMTEGSALLIGMIWGFAAAREWSNARGDNIIDTGAHFYETYETSDGSHVAVGPIEPQFYALFCDCLGLADDAAFAAQMDAAVWPELKHRLSVIFKTRSRDAWARLFLDTDAWVVPVLSMQEAPQHPHNKARAAFVDVEGVRQPAPAPR